MKKLIIISFFLTVAVGTTIGQPNKSIFGKTQTSWNVAFHTMPDWVQTDSLVISSDTLINGQYYRIVNGQYNFDGFIREDTMTGRAWYLDKSWGKKEFLIMDLSLNVGDTFSIHRLEFPEDSLAIVDSIKYESGNKKIYLSTNDNPVLSKESLTFIEGTGPNAGIISQLYQSAVHFGDGSILLCAHKDSIQTYTNSSLYFIGQCFVLWGGIEENQLNKFKLTLFPNPTSDKVQIDYKGSLPYSIEIMNYTGKFISSKTDINSSTLDFDMTQYPHGIYLLKVTGNDGKFATGSILKL